MTEKIQPHKLKMRGQLWIRMRHRLRMYGRCNPRFGAVKAHSFWNAASERTPFYFTFSLLPLLYALYLFRHRCVIFPVTNGWHLLTWTWNERKEKALALRPFNMPIHRFYCQGSRRLFPLFPDAFIVCFKLVLNFFQPQKVTIPRKNAWCLPTSFLLLEIYPLHVRHTLKLWTLSDAKTPNRTLTQQHKHSRVCQLGNSKLLWLREARGRWAMPRSNVVSPPLADSLSFKNRRDIEMCSIRGKYITVLLYLQRDCRGSWLMWGSEGTVLWFFLLSCWENEARYLRCRYKGERDSYPISCTFNT